MENDSLKFKMKAKRNINCDSILHFGLSFCILILAFSIIPSAHAATFNHEINYQGKLINGSGTTVPDGNYSLQFGLYTQASGGSPIWSETWCDTSDCKASGSGYDNRVKVQNGLFSVMLGSTTPFDNLDFNQTLFLGVNIGGSAASTTWDGEMSPRKVIGAVPAAFYAATSTYSISICHPRHSPGQRPLLRLLIALLPQLIH